MPEIARSGGRVLVGMCAKRALTGLRLCKPVASVELLEGPLTARQRCVARVPRVVRGCVERPCRAL